MPRRTSSYKSARGFSLYFDTNDNLPEFYKEYPQLTVETIKKTAQDAMTQTWSMTPQKTGQLRNNTDVIAYGKGALGGTVYARWLAQDPRSGYHYAIVQEVGGTKDYIFVDYTTAGTGPGFIKKTWEIISQNAMNDLQTATNQLIHKVSVR
jgi:hypothetical protein